MELLESIKTRRSIRKFQDKKIDKKFILDLIECARLAPSAANRQPWTFYVLDKENKNKVAEFLEENLLEKEFKPYEHATKEYSPTASLKESIRIIKECPILILVFRNNDPSWLEGDYLSIGCAVEHIALRATDLGLSSIWLRDVIYKRKEIANYFTNNSLELVTGIAIGYANQIPYKKYLKDLKSIAKFI